MKAKNQELFLLDKFYRHQPKYPVAINTNMQTARIIAAKNFSLGSMLAPEEKRVFEIIVG
jgi:hypothetical protein